MNSMICNPKLSQYHHQTSLILNLNICNTGIINSCCPDGIEQQMIEHATYKFSTAINDQLQPLLNTLTNFEKRFTDILLDKIAEIKVRISKSINASTNGDNNAHFSTTPEYRHVLLNVQWHLQRISYAISSSPHTKSPSPLPYNALDDSDGEVPISLEDLVIPVIFKYLTTRSLALLPNNESLTAVGITDIPVLFEESYSRCFKQNILTTYFPSRSEEITTTKNTADPMAFLQDPFSWVFPRDPSSLPLSPRSITSPPVGANYVAILLRLIGSGKELLKPLAAPETSGNHTLSTSPHISWPLSNECVRSLTRMHLCQECIPLSSSSPRPRPPSLLKGKRREINHFNDVERSSAAVPGPSQKGFKKQEEVEEEGEEGSSNPICRGFCGDTLRSCLSPTLERLGQAWGPYLRLLKQTLNKSKLKLLTRRHSSSKSSDATDLLQLPHTYDVSSRGGGSFDKDTTYIHNPYQTRIQTLIEWFQSANLTQLRENATIICGSPRYKELNENLPKNLTSPAEYLNRTREDSDGADLSYDSTVREFIEELDDDNKWKKVSLVSTKLGAIFSDIPDQICSQDLDVSESNKNCWDGERIVARYNRTTTLNTYEYDPMKNSTPTYKINLLPDSEINVLKFDDHLNKFRTLIEGVQILISRPNLLTIRAKERAEQVAKTYASNNHHLFQLQNGNGNDAIMDISRNTAGTQGGTNRENKDAGNHPIRTRLPEKSRLVVLPSNDGMSRLIDNNNLHFGSSLSDNYKLNRRESSPGKSNPTLTDLEMPGSKKRFSSYGSGSLPSISDDGGNLGHHHEEENVDISTTKTADSFPAASSNMRIKEGERKGTAGDGELTFLVNEDDEDDNNSVRGNNNSGSGHFEGGDDTTLLRPTNQDLGGSQASPDNHVGNGRSPDGTSKFDDDKLSSKAHNTRIISLKYVFILTLITNIWYHLHTRLILHVP